MSSDLGPLDGLVIEHAVMVLSALASSPIKHSKLWGSDLKKGFEP